MSFYYKFNWHIQPGAVFFCTFSLFSVYGCLWVRDKEKWEMRHETFLLEYIMNNGNALEFRQGTNGIL